MMNRLDNPLAEVCLVQGYHVIDDRIYNPIGEEIPDAPCSALDLGVRSKNLLIKAEKQIKLLSHSTVMVTDLLRMSERQLCSLPNIGFKSACDIISQVENYLRSPEKYQKSQKKKSDNQKEPAKKDINPWNLQYFAPGYEVVDGVIRNRTTLSLTDDVPVSSLGLTPHVLACTRGYGLRNISDLIGMEYGVFTIRTGLGPHGIQETSAKLSDYLEKHQMDYGQSSSATKLVTPRNILRFLGEYEFQGVSAEQLRERFHDADEALINNLLDQQIAAGTIEKDGPLFCKTHRSFFRYAYGEAREENPKLTDRSLEVIHLHSQGYSLDEIAQRIEVTRERVRQLEHQAFSILTKDYSILYTEDTYAYLYTTYAISKEMFTEALKQSSQDWYYLSIRYKSGKQNPLEILKDSRVSGNDQHAFEQYFHRNEIYLQGRYIQKTKVAIEDYLLETCCQEEISIDEFLTILAHFVQDNNLDSSLIPTAIDEKTALINRLMGHKKVLWKLNMRLRYYDTTAKDFEELLDALGLDKFHDIKISTLMLYNAHPRLMRQYDIRDEYELHNLLRKINAEKRFPALKIRKMPGLLFGSFDRDEAVKRLMLELAPVSPSDLSLKLSEKYGYSVASIRGSWLKCISEYFHDGLYWAKSNEPAQS